MIRWLGTLTLAAALLAGPTRAQEGVHGANSTFLSPTVKLAWAVRRGQRGGIAAKMLSIG